MAKPTPLERYWSKIDTSGGQDACWPWTTGKTHGGYGRFAVTHTRTVVASRWGYGELVGPVPDGMFVLHRCDNPPYCNPRHWFLGTTQDNADDRCAKGRHIHGPRHHSARLVESDVVDIKNLRAGGATYAEIARRYGISDVAIRNAVVGESWKHVA